MDPAQFYTGLVAQLYGALRSSTPDTSVYRDFIAASGEPALELGCGDGDPLLPLRAAGLDVDGVDSSADMLQRLRAFAAEQGLTVSVFEQRMQDLDLPRRYRSIFLAGPTFTVLPDDAAAVACLQAIRRHLTPDGQALIPLWIPPRTPEDQFGILREQPDPHGDGTIAIAVMGERYDDEGRIRVSRLRYEWRRAGGEVEALEREWLIHWYTPTGFAGLAETAGLRVIDVRDDDGREPADDAEDFTVRLAR